MKPGEIIHAEPGFAIMYLGDDKFLAGEQLIEVPRGFLAKRESFMTGNFLVGLSWAYFHADTPRENRHPLNIRNDEQAKGYAYGMHLMPNLGMRMDQSNPRTRAWAALQKNPTKNLFAVHPHIEKLMIATFSGDVKGQIEAYEQFLAELKAEYQQ